jgi:hypothetical protein
MSVPDDRKIFNDGEIAVILQKAAELQAERGGRASGLSLEELRQVASEAGIEPHLVEEAVQQMRTPAPPSEPPGRSRRKGQTRWEQRLELPVRLDNEAVRAVVAHLEAEFGGQGAITELSCGTVSRTPRSRLAMQAPGSTSRSSAARSGSFCGESVARSAARCSESPASPPGNRPGSWC